MTNRSRSKFLLCLLGLVCAIAVSAAETDSHIIGHVLDGANGEHLAYVSIQLKGTNIGGLTDESGHYFLKNLPLGKQTVVCSFVGYQTVEREVTLYKDSTLILNITLNEISYQLDNVVITADRYATKQKETATMINVVSPLVIESTNSACVADVLGFQTGLRVETGCANCGKTSLQINGLGGEYSQILMDSRPVFSSLATVYGLEQIPTGMVDRIEVIRGGGSAVFGSNAIAGVVNIITKEPTRNFLNVTHTTMLTEKGTFDINTAVNASVISQNEKIGLFVFGVQRNRKQYDRDDDGFSDIPKLGNTTVGFRSFFKTTDYSKLIAEYHHTTEFRRGGYGIDSLQPHESPLTEQLKHNIDAGSLTWNYFTADNRHHLSVYASTQHIARDSYFGTHYDPNAYGYSKDFTIIGGGRYDFSYPCGKMPGQLTAGLEYSYNRMRDRILAYNRDMTQNVHIYGGFVQNEWKNEQWTIQIGARLEKHNLLSKPVVLPRANIRFTPIANLVLRLSYTRGYRPPQVYEEDLHVEAVGGNVSIIDLDPNLKPENNNSVSASVDYYHSFGSCEINFLAEGFYNRLDDIFTLVENGHDDSGNLHLLRTNKKGANVAGLNLEAQIAVPHRLTFQAGYSYQYSRYIEPFQWSESLPAQKQMFRMPEHHGFFLLDIEPVHRFHINVNGKITGSMLVQHLAGFVSEDCEVHTPVFGEIDAKLSYAVPLYRYYTLELFVGVKNALDMYQRDLDQGINRDASYVYGPAIPRSWFFGLNLKI